MGKLIAALERCAPPEARGAAPRLVYGAGMAAFAVRALLAATAAVEEALERDDLPRAREGLRSLVSRDTAGLPAPLLAAAAIESVTENTADSAVAPLFWY